MAVSFVLRAKILSIEVVPRQLELEKTLMNTVAGAAEHDTRKTSHSDMNDWLNVLVRKRIAEAKENGETLAEEVAWVSETGHSVYQRRFKPFVVLILAVSAFGILQAPSLVVLLATVAIMYFYVDFYSGVLHVVLDNPRFIRLPLIGVPCVEFQWHHTFAYDISTRKLLDVWGDLNVLLFVKSLFLFGICGFNPTTLMVAGVGYSLGYANQLSHRLAHTAPRKRPKLATWLQDHHVILPPAVHHVHHATYDQSFPVLNGHSRTLIQAMLRVVPNGFAWLALFLLLSAFDLVVVAWLVGRILALG